MTDHKAEALAWIRGMDEIIEEEGMTDATLVASPVNAQVHATLYLAEQQRIANLIALATADDMTDPLTNKWESGLWETARTQIIEGLGL